MNQNFYVCACDPGEFGGIYRYDLSESGKMTQLGFSPLPGTNYLCFSPDRNTLYATLNTAGGEGGAAAFRIQEDGALVFLNSMESLGRAACHVTCSPDGRFLYCANYTTGNFTEFALKDDGSIGERTQVIQHHGSGPRTDRQEGPHTHCCVFTPDDGYLCVNDLGTDEIMVYPYTEKGLIPEAKPLKCEPGEGPRHILFDRTGKIAYVINELGNSVTSLRYHDGSFERLGCWSTLPEHCTAVTKASAIRLSPDERYLYASNRGFDSIACYAVPEPGKLELQEIVSAFGSSPRDINYLPGYGIFAAANEFSDVVCFYDADAVSGRLTYREDHDLAGLPRPLCILF